MPRDIVPKFESYQFAHKEFHSCIITGFHVVKVYEEQNIGPHVVLVTYVEVKALLGNIAKICFYTLLIKFKYMYMKYYCRFQTLLTQT